MQSLLRPVVASTANDEDSGSSSSSSSPSPPSGDAPRGPVPVLHIRRAEGVFSETGLAVWGAALVLAEFALAQPNLVARGNRIGGEVSVFDPAIVAGLAERGIDLVPGQGEDSGVHAVLIREGGRVDGGYDPRREGVVLIGTP